MPVLRHTNMCLSVQRIVYSRTYALCEHPSGYPLHLLTKSPEPPAGRRSVVLSPWPSRLSLLDVTHMMPTLLPTAHPRPQGYGLPNEQNGVHPCKSRHSSSPLPPRTLFCSSAPAELPPSPIGSHQLTAIPLTRLVSKREAKSNKDGYWRSLGKDIPPRAPRGVIFCPSASCPGQK
ncbi:hypothetical protein K402DRAFT_111723 [Aulographum hederae CBS 113979]|uniref:Uncharacterized protein n=1 Tax=Aulographum hederae CBS 113979 TaxID=1176131 RepID=A0A6G1GW61_9PEZI|nr:hypothetical protein K402DRAFT_111723 [Aulographum hederae CBS 113979]